ncbi:conserved hypothetical protein [Ricinus communis]|uniref:Uncharacterized protein n=1 Tax=Ricinus communis TaxID=3988 RepID=B9TJ30_RICCO|nr:conserved hypothetical protein [Ricinus communis]
MDRCCARAGSPVPAPAHESPRPSAWPARRRCPAGSSRTPRRRSAPSGRTGVSACPPARRPPGSGTGRLSGGRNGHCRP